MPYINEPYKFVYKAKNFTSGLTDVKLVVYKPNMVKLGVYVLTEINQGDGKGVYYYDFTDADMIGTYTFICNCASAPLKDARSLYFDSRQTNSQSIFDEIVEGTIDLKAALQIILAVLAGKTEVTELGEDRAAVVFRNVSDTTNTVEGIIDNCERTSMTYDTE